MSSNDGFAGVSNCYVFKSRLQEYAQKVGLPTPLYDTIKEGPPHVPSFKSTVIVNDVRYDSLPGFSNRKAAEQSAAEVALVELAKSGNMKECISQPVHETGLCKNLLQEYAQKMNYAIPMYVCQKDESPGRAASFSCTVEIGGIRYIGAAARTKKEAEIKAARTALLAIRANTDGVGEKSIGNTQLTVIPGKKKGPESGNLDEPAKALKPKKARFKTKGLRKKFPGNKVGNDQVEDTRGMEVDIDNQVGSELLQTDASMVQVAESGLLSMESKENVEEEKSIVNHNGGDKTVAEGDPIPDIIGNCQNGQATASDIKKTDHKAPPELGISSMSPAEVLVTVAMEVNKVSEAGLVDSAIMNSSKKDQTEAASAAKDFKQMGANEDDFKSNGASALGIVASNLG